LNVASGTVPFIVLLFCPAVFAANFFRPCILISFQQSTQNFIAYGATLWHEKAKYLSKKKQIN
jgi:hypothetical protein